MTLKHKAIKIITCSLLFCLYAFAVASAEDLQAELAVYDKVIAEQAGDPFYEEIGFMSDTFLDPDPYLARSKIQQNLGDSDAAIKDMQRAFSQSTPYDTDSMRRQENTDSMRRRGRNPYPTNKPVDKLKYDIANYTKTISETPYNPGAYESRGRLYQTLGLYQKAIEDFKQTTFLTYRLNFLYLSTPKTATAYMKRAEFNRLAGRHSNMRQDYAQAMQLEPNSTEQFLQSSIAARNKNKIYSTEDTYIPSVNNSYFSVGRSYEYLGNQAAALKNYTKSIDLGLLNKAYNTDEVYLARARLYEKTGNLKQAKDDLNARIVWCQKKGYHSELYWERGKFYLRQNQLAAAIHDFTTEIKHADSTDPADAVHYLCRGMAYERSGETAKAAIDFTEADKLTAKFYGNRSDASMQAGEFTAARHAAQKAIQLDPKEPWHYIRLGNIYQEQENYQAAIDCYQQATKADPAFGISYGNIGNSLACLKQYGRALLYYQKQLKLGPVNAWIYNKRSKLYLKIDLPEKALADAKLAIATDEKFAEAYVTLGEIYTQLKQPTLAQENYSKAFDLDTILFYEDQTQALPNNANAFIALGNAYAKEGRYAPAMPAYQKAVELSPSNPEAYEARGDAYSALRHYQQALDAYTKALSLNPHNAQLLDKRRDVYMETKQYEKALADTNALVAIDPHRHNLLGEIYHATGDFVRAKLASPKDAYVDRFGEGIIYRTDSLYS